MYGWANLNFLCFTKTRTTMRVLTTFLVQNAVNPMFNALIKTTCTSWNFHVKQIWGIYLYWFLHISGVSLFKGIIHHEWTLWPKCVNMCRVQFRVKEVFGCILFMPANPSEYKNLETFTTLCIIRMLFSTMSKNTLPKSPKRPSKCSQCLSVRAAFSTILVLFP